MRYGYQNELEEECYIPGLYRNSKQFQTDGDSNEHSCQSEPTNSPSADSSDSNRQTPVHQDESAEDYVVYDPDVYIKDEIDERKSVSRKFSGKYFDRLSWGEGCSHQNLSP